MKKIILAVCLVCVCSLTACYDGSGREETTTTESSTEDSFGMNVIIDEYALTLPTEYGGLPGWVLDSSNVTYTYGLEPGGINSLCLYKEGTKLVLVVKNKTEQTLSTFAGSTVIGATVYYGEANTGLSGISSTDTKEVIEQKFGTPEYEDDSSLYFTKGNESLVVTFTSEGSLESATLQRVDEISAEE